MLNNNLIGFYENQEYLPKDFDEFNSVIKLRQLFLNLSNNIFGCSCQFTKYEQNKLAKHPLKDAFTYKIDRLMPFSFIKTWKKQNKNNFKLCINSTKIINNYLNNEFK
jgi:hypothetical protein